MNKYKGVEVKNIFQASRELEPVEGRFDGGIASSISPQDIELNQSPNSNCVRVERGALTQEYGTRVMGSAASTPILVLGQHRQVIIGEESLDFIYRVFRKPNSYIRIESWSSLGWSGSWNVIIDSNSHPINQVLLGHCSTLGRLFLADGDRTYMLDQSSIVNSYGNDFPSGNLLTAVNQQTVTTISPGNANQGIHAINYRLSFFGNCGDPTYVKVAALYNSVEIGESTVNIPPSNDYNRVLHMPWLSFNAIAQIPSGGQLVFQVKAYSGTPSYVTNELQNMGSGFPLWRGFKNPAVDGYLDYYWFAIDLDGFESTTQVNFYINKGSGWVLKETLTVWERGRYYAFVEEDGMGPGSQFGVHVSSGTLYITAASVSFYMLGTFQVHAFNKPVDGDPDHGVKYDVVGVSTATLTPLYEPVNILSRGKATAATSTTLTDSTKSWTPNAFVGKTIFITSGLGKGQMRTISSNTATQVTVSSAWSQIPNNTSSYEICDAQPLKARYLAAFANRVIALHSGKDPQRLSWCQNGFPLLWTGDGAGSVIRDSRSDPIDELMGFVPLAPNVGALFRRSSIEKVTATGVPEPALAFSSWIERVGTMSPRSITIVPGGAMFLGHDRMVYYLTERNISSVGLSIKEELEMTASNLEFACGSFDELNQNFYLGVPGAYSTNVVTTWIFDFGRFAATGESVWQRMNVSANQISYVMGDRLVFVDLANQVLMFDRNSVAASGYWISPTLNRNSRIDDYTLSRVILRYESEGSSYVTIDASGDGGVTWVSGFKPIVHIFQTNGNTRQAVQGFNVTGPDLRFRVTFVGDPRVYLRSWRAEIIPRGNIRSYP